MTSYYNDIRTDTSSNHYYGAPGAPQPTYNQSSYQPPRDDGYREEMTVARYDDDRSRYSGERSRYDDRDYDDRRSHQPNDRYDERRSTYDERERSDNRSRRSSRSHKASERGLFGDEGRDDHHRGKDVGATLVGGAVGAFAGHELGHNKLTSTLGALAGAFAGHELEKRHEKKKERRQSEQQSFEYETRRDSTSNSKGLGAEYSDDEDYDERRRQHHHHHHRRDSDRYD